MELRNDGLCLLELSKETVSWRLFFGVVSDKAAEDAGEMDFLGGKDAVRIGWVTGVKGDGAGIRRKQYLF